MVLIVAGFLTFGSVFVTGLAHFGDFTDFDARAKSDGARALIGMGMIIVGGILMGIGSKGLAGSGVVLDPGQARKDVEPWARMAGGVIKDAVEETGIDLGGVKSGEASEADFDEKLRKLHKLYQDGILTEAEYEKEKKEILDSA